MTSINLTNRSGISDSWDDYCSDSKQSTSFAEAFETMAGLENQLNQAKDRIGNLDAVNANIRTITRGFLNIDQNMKNAVQRMGGKIVTQDWFKIVEIINRFNLMNSESCVHLDVNSLPGSFIAGAHFLANAYNIDYQWFACGDKRQAIDPFCLQNNKYSENWILGNGFDVINPLFVDHLLKNHKNSVDLFTSNYGISLKHSKQYNDAEDLHMNGQLGQFLCAMAVLKNGGSAVFRMFTFFRKFSISLLYMMTVVFKSVEVFKPKSSKLNNSECYLVCTGFLYKETDEKELINPLQEIMGNIRSSLMICQADRIPGDILDNIIAAAKMVHGTQISYIDRYLKIAVDSINKYPDNDDAAKECAMEVYHQFYYDPKYLESIGVPDIVLDDDKVLEVADTKWVTVQSSTRQKKNRFRVITYPRIYEIAELSKLLFDLLDERRKLSSDTDTHSI
jgi:23S rRNA U2552 (ribose-2'-O)-methylase RlmE/FtsJ/DNA-binding FrmR family transcriptional regulator